MVKPRKRRPTINQAKKSILSLIEENQDRSIIELCRELPENRNGFDRRGHVCRTVIDEYFDNLPVEEQKELVLQLRERLPFDEYAAIERLDELEQRERAETIILSLSSDATKQVRQFIDGLEPPDAEYMVDAYLSLEVDERDEFLSKTTNYQGVLDRFNLLPFDEQDAIIFDVQQARQEMNAATLITLSQEQRDAMLFERLERQLSEFADDFVPFLEDVQKLPVDLNNKLEDRLEQVSNWALERIYTHEGKNASDGTQPERFKFDFTFCWYLQLRLGFSRDTLASILVDYHVVSDYVLREGRGLLRHFKWYGPTRTEDGQYVSLDNIQNSCAA